MTIDDDYKTKDWVTLFTRHWNDYTTGKKLVLLNTNGLLKTAERLFKKLFKKPWSVDLVLHTLDEILLNEIHPIRMNDAEKSRERDIYFVNAVADSSLDRNRKNSGNRAWIAPSLSPAIVILSTCWIEAILFLASPQDDENLLQLAEQRA